MVSGLGYPNCGAPPLQGTPVCNSALSDWDRASWIASQISASDQANMIVDTAAGVASLGLPSYNYQQEGLHGLYLAHNTGSGAYACQTSFPQVSLTASSFNRSLFHFIGSTVGSEARATYNGQGAASGVNVYAPNINLWRDPRWGRGQETPGEDPFLSSVYAYEYITGLQNDTAIDPTRVKTGSMCKHFVGYDVEDERYNFPAVISDQDMVESYIAPFKACIKDAGAVGVMCSYNLVNGQPACAHPFLIQSVLREKWGWNGVVTTDCNLVPEVLMTGYAMNNPSAAVGVSMGAGVDQQCGSLPSYTMAAWNNGYITTAQLANATAREMLMWVKMGFFDYPLGPLTTRLGAVSMYTAAAKQTELQAAQQGIVLLQNTNALLPLSVPASGVLFVGPNANSGVVQLGNYYTPTLCSPVTTPFSASPGSAFSIGCNINDHDTSRFIAAVSAARSASVVIFVGGLDQTQESELVDRESIALSATQTELIVQLAATGVPLVCVLMSGGSIDTTPIQSSCGAIVWVGYPGPQGGTAVMDVLYGRVSPSGRLTTTWYPASYITATSMADMSWRTNSATNPYGRSYRFYTGSPVYPFGYGLSYTSWSYSSASTSGPNSVSDDLDTVFSWTVTVTNSGSRTSDLVLLCYVSSSTVASDAPVRELADFQRMAAVPAGGSASVTFNINARVLAHVDPWGRQWRLPGTYQLQMENLWTRFTLDGDATVQDDWPGAPDEYTPFVPPSTRSNFYSGAAPFLDLFGQWWHPWGSEVNGDAAVEAFPELMVASTDFQLYQSVLMGTSFVVTVPKASSITIVLIEPEYTTAGSRVFSVWVQGNPVLENLDMAGTVGKGVILAPTFSVSGKGITIQFIASVGQAVCVGIQVNS